MNERLFGLEFLAETEVLFFGGANRKANEDGTFQYPSYEQMVEAEAGGGYSTTMGEYLRWR